MQRFRWILTLAGLLATGPLLAQEMALSDMYGRGVHAYFSGQPQIAYERLTAAIKAGSHDPRAYYFRGLAYQWLGRPQEALADFRAGAALEHQDAGGVFGVDRSLERVQGPSRLMIERERAIARVGAARGVVLERQKRSISAQAAMPEVSAPKETVLTEPAANLNELPGPGASPPVKGEVDKPFNEPADPNAPPAPVARPKPPAANPLNEVPPEPAAPAKPAKPMPAQADPFGAPAAAPPTANPPAAAGESGSGAALGNALKRAFGGFVPEMPQIPPGLPIGGNAAPPEAPAKPPAANPPAAKPAEADPFGAPSPAKPAPAKNDNPFGNP